MIHECLDFRYTETRTIRRGDLFRVSGGPLYQGLPWGVRGTFRFQSAFYVFHAGSQTERRWYVVCEEIQRDAIDHKTGRLTITRSHVLFVAGPPYRNAVVPEIEMRPYQIVRLRREGKTARRRGIHTDQLQLEPAR